MKFVFLLIVAFVFISCGKEVNNENYNIKIESDIVLTKDNHPHGWEQNQCFQCHIKENIHNVDKIKSPMLPYAEPLIKKSGLRSCAGCHGANGTEPPQ